MAEQRFDPRLYLVTDRRWLRGRSLAGCVDQAIRGGVTLVQLREKEIASRAFLDLAREVKAVTDRHGVPLIVNDRVDIALAVDAAGVHLGREDLPVAVARRLLGEAKIVGASAATLAEALALEAQGADYLGIGALYPTATKSATRSVSPADLAAIKAAVRIPVVAIGGIKADRLPAIRAAGADGVAVVTALLDRPDICASAWEMTALWGVI
jgi:thiamine-phosphate pyrophosphorylase